MYALIALGVILLGAAVWRPFMRIVGARPSRKAAENHPKDEIIRPFSIYFFGAAFSVIGAYFIVVLSAGAISGMLNYDGYMDFALMSDLLKVPFRF